MTDYIQVTTTVSRQDDAQRIADELVGRRLAACVQISGPIRSTYWWQGQIETADEWRCDAKTRLDRYDALVAAIGELHTYETPEIIATRVEQAAEKYLAWIDGTLDG